MESNSFFLELTQLLKGSYRITLTFILLLTLQFPSPNSGPLDNIGEVCVYERMFKDGLRFHLPKITRDLLCSPGVAPYQIAPNGWHFLLASYMLWPQVNPGHEMSIEEFLIIYCPKPCKISGFVYYFTFRDKSQIIDLGNSLSNSKGWLKEFFFFFFVLGNWEGHSTEDLDLLPHQLRVARRFCPLLEGSKFIISLLCHFFVLVY
jgi:hypothetical protein